MIWAVVPAAGRGSRFGGDLPKQYAPLYGRTVLHHTLLALARHRSVEGIMVALAPGDPHWPGFRELAGKPVLQCDGGRERADSVLAALQALPKSVRERDWVLVHDAARPCLVQEDLERLLEHGAAHGVGALLAAPARDTIKRVDENGEVLRTEPRDAMWRAFTPQMFRRATLTRALESARAGGLSVTDEASAVERLGLFPMVVEGSEDNLKITTSGDLALAESILGRLARSSA
ncbi:MAG: 2-C-methyl-D-erythritol 4-phosphate cytidylyltransferase [Xanthomonadales bacterium]|nr:2-C-methyl-D-erythritol 4-phosphate cytidylyltransferase [Xanthomonadales bacterium]